KDLDVPLIEIDRISQQVNQLSLEKYTTAEVGEPTLRDILSELEKPGRDPRAEFTYALFADGIHDIKDLETGIVLEGIVTNVANFGAFVDIGVHQDGLVHVSQMANRFVSDPKDVVQVGQVVKVQVLEVQEKLKRISLSMRLTETENTLKNVQGNVKMTGNKAISRETASQNRMKPTLKKKASGVKLASQEKWPQKQATSNQKNFSSEDLEKRFNRRQP
ncbi:MAG: S1 RNA-binding domain-containing protein, partial [Phormidesmis sp.]